MNLNKRANKVEYQKNWFIKDVSTKKNQVKKHIIYAKNNNSILAYLYIINIYKAILFLIAAQSI